MDWLDWLEIIFKYLLPFILAVVLVFTFFLPIGTTTENVLAYSVESTQNSSGTFFLGSGGVHTDPVYYVYIQNDDKSLSLVTLKAKEIKLFLDVPVGEDAFIVYEVRQYKGFDSKDPIELHVPENTLIKQYDFRFSE